MVIPEWVPIPDNLRYNAAVARLDKAVYSLIAERRGARRGGGGDGNGGSFGGGDAGTGTGTTGATGATGTGTTGTGPDLLDRLLDAKDDGEGGDGGGMDDRSLRDELMTLMVAGQETSAILLSWSCALLAQHPRQGRSAHSLNRALFSIQGGLTGMIHAILYGQSLVVKDETDELRRA